MFAIGLPKSEWITNVMLDETLDYIYVTVNTKLLVYNWKTSTEISSFQACERQITCVMCYHPYGFTILGSKDGKIKIHGLDHVLVHEFQSQYKPITSLAFYPYGPVILASAADKSIRMYNLRSFKESRYNIEFI
ncbi:hypothetical protein HK100_009759 [Physocladia obscura]|uniref:Uncharacterized protein n=1 Tax=Physocladia obscura TaxID=109957 RepID=A0AAD5T301_9FUNG|nr:hypothetical protein HK100_009759 [Physocladia obscura]